jgi:hypothetical protein
MKYPISGNFYVIEEYLRVLLANLWYNSIFRPGVTYTNRFVGNAAQMYVFKLATKNVELTQPAGDFKHEIISDELMSIQLNNAWRTSKKIYDIQASNVPFNVVSETMANCAREISLAWNKSGLAALLKEGIGWTMEMPETDEYSVKDVLLEAKNEMFKNLVEGKIVLCTPDFYTLILKAAGNLFTPALNDAMVRSAMVGEWLGLTFVNCNMLQASVGELAYYNYNGNVNYASPEDMGSLQFIMYDPMAFSIATNFNKARVHDSENFFGSLVQVEMVSGFRVTEPRGVLISRVA